MTTSNPPVEYIRQTPVLVFDSTDKAAQWLLDFDKAHKMADHAVTEAWRSRRRSDLDQKRRIRANLLHLVHKLERKYPHIPRAISRAGLALRTCR